MTIGVFQHFRNKKFYLAEGFELDASADPLVRRVVYYALYPSTEEQRKEDISDYQRWSRFESEFFRKEDSGVSKFTQITDKKVIASLVTPQLPGHIKLMIEELL